MEEKVFFQNSNRLKLCGVLSNPTNDLKNPIIILVHGFATGKDRKSTVSLSNELNKKNISTFRFDLFAHGESEGSFEDITMSEAVDDILQAIHFVKEKGYIKIGLIGSSFGGMASVVSASKTDDLFVLGLKCPVSDYIEVWAARRTPEQIQQWKRTNMEMYTNSLGTAIKIKFGLYEDAIKYNVYEIAKDIHIPTIIIHGDVDDNVPVSQSIKTAESIPNCKLVIIPGATHRFERDGELEKNNKEFVNFVVSNVE